MKPEKNKYSEFQILAYNSFPVIKLIPLNLIMHKQHKPSLFAYTKPCNNLRIKRKEKKKDMKSPVLDTFYNLLKLIFVTELSLSFSLT